ATGNGLIFSTFLGGDSRDIGEDIVLDAAGNYYVTGYTFSENFPTKNAYQSDFGGYSDAFITKLNATGNGLLFCTFLGDDNRDRGLDISIDSAGNSYITGDTNSINFPIVNAYQSAFGGGESDVFVTKLNATGNGLLYSTFVGGSNFEFGFGTVVDDAGHCGVVGFTTSSDFPVANAFQSIYGGGESDAFVLRLDTTDSTLLFSTFLGGNLADQGSAIAVDDVGHYYVVGITYSYNFPVVDAYQGTLNTEGNDVFAAKLDHSGNLLFSTYFGGLFEELGSDIAVGTNGQFYIAGATFSEDFPLENAYQTSPQGYYDAFITKFSYDPTSGPTSSPTSTTSTDSFTITIFLIATFPLILAIKRRRKVF
ncbi:MAG: SBBP repeat-containing protein, partial [Candidatus Hodarchaeota archaeon]